MTECTNDCFDEGEQQVDELCKSCQEYCDSIEAEARREYKVSPAYWAWHKTRCSGCEECIDD